jgi:hypothetical protein
MTRPLRQRLYDMADLAVAFATLEAVRLPEREMAPTGACAAAIRCTPERHRTSSTASADAQLARRRRPALHD